MTRETIKEVCSLSEFVDETIKALDQRTEKVMSDKRCCISPVIQCFDGMTNGNALISLYPDLKYTIQNGRVITTIGVASSFDLDWWNAPYKKGGEE